MNKYTVLRDGKPVAEIEASGRFAAQVIAEIDYGCDGGQISVKIIEPTKQE